MSRHTVEVFHALMKKGWIDRHEDGNTWKYIEDVEVQEELEDFKNELGIDIFRTGDRYYMVPTQENDLFLKNNQDYRADIHANNSVRNRDLYLLNYLSIYLIYLFFNGEGTNPQCREFISKEDLMHAFTEHCRLTKEHREGSEDVAEYSEKFYQLGEIWLSKMEGNAESNKFDTRYGVINRILGKYKTDELFETDEAGLIRPTRKMRDLMPYFLRKDRIQEIQSWLKGETKHAEN